MNYPGKKKTSTIRALNIPPPNTHQPHFNRSPFIRVIFLMGLYIFGGLYQNILCTTFLFCFTLLKM